jgi:hypothetical protein
LCESTEHATRDHAESVEVGISKFNYPGFFSASSSIASGPVSASFSSSNAYQLQSSIVLKYSSPPVRLSFSQALAKQEADRSHTEKHQLQNMKLVSVSEEKHMDYIPVFETLIAGQRVVCGGCLKYFCGSVYVEGVHCFYCESFEHDSSQCNFTPDRQNKSSSAVVDGRVQDNILEATRASEPLRLSFSKALARQQIEREKAEEEARKKLLSIDDDEQQPAANLTVKSVWIPKVSNKGWRAYANEADKQFLQWAVYANDIEAVVDFLEGRNGAPVFDVDHSDFTKQTAIHRAAQSRCIAICKRLIDYGCDYNGQDVSGTSPVLIFARDGNAVQLEAFIEMCK